MLRVLDPFANVRILLILVRSAVRYRELLWEMTRRDLFERQAGLAFSGFWVIGQPLLMMLIYVFVFSFIFNVRAGANGSRLDYTAFLLAGVAPWLAFQEAVGRAPTCFTESKNLIKQIVFPIEILPLKLTLSTLLPLGVGAAFPLVLTVLAGTARPVFWLLLPIPVLSYLLLTIGVTYMIAAAGVFIRDVRNVVQLALMIGLFVQPILYVPGMLPKWAEIGFQLSPFSHVIWIFRDALLGTDSHLISWIVAPISGVAFLMIGYRVFRTLRHMFGDAL
jgi:lipopolysaccharide transport system permease protein